MSYMKWINSWIFTHQSESVSKMTYWLRNTIHVLLLRASIHSFLCLNFQANVFKVQLFRCTELCTRVFFNAKSFWRNTPCCHCPFSLICSHLTAGKQRPRDCGRASSILLAHRGVSHYSTMCDWVNLFSI